MAIVYIFFFLFLCSKNLGQMVSKHLFKIKGSLYPVALIVIYNDYNVKFIDVRFPYRFVVLHFTLLGYYIVKTSNLIKFAGKLNLGHIQFKLFE